MYVIIWEFQVKPERAEAFENVYGPAGAWAKLFRRGEGFIGTELLRDANDARRYLTIDRWISVMAYDIFRMRWASEYEALDTRCEELTEHESLVGNFTMADE